MGEEGYSATAGGDGGNGDGEKLLDERALFFQWLKPYKVLSPEESKQIRRKMIAAGQDGRQKDYLACKNELVMGNIKLVLFVARRYAGRQTNFLELVSAGAKGLMRAAEKYNPDRAEFSAEFSTYAVSHILQGILTEVYSNRTIRISPNIHDYYKKIVKAQERLESKGKFSTDEEIAAELGCVPAKVRDVRDAVNRKCRSLSYLVDDEYLEYELADDNAAIPDRESAKNELRQKISAALHEQLPFRDREIVKLRFGLYDNSEFTLDKIGKIFRMTRERIRQIEEKSLARLRRNKELKMMEAYV